MLVLSRLTDEQIVIGEGDRAVVVTIVEIRKSQGKVRLGIEAPQDVPVHRREIYDAIHQTMKEKKPLRLIEDRLDAEENQNKDAPRMTRDAKDGNGKPDSKDDSNSRP
jgi:carbon storage regulator